MDENATHHFPLLEPSLIPSRMLKPNVSEYCFQNKRFLFLKTSYRVSINILDYPPRRIAGLFFRNSHGSASEMNCWTTLQGNSSENLPLKFLSQPFSIYALTPNFLGCPGAYGMHYAISKQFMLIYQVCINMSYSHCMLFIQAITHNKVTILDSSNRVPHGPFTIMNQFGSNHPYNIKQP